MSKTKQPAPTKPTVSTSTFDHRARLNRVQNIRDAVVQLSASGGRDALNKTTLRAWAKDAQLRESVHRGAEFMIWLDRSLGDAVPLPH